MSIDNKIDQTDLTFFTNEEGHTLLSRFISTLKDTQLFDVIVGYFRASGFYQLYDALEPVEKIRILVGLSVDRDSYEMMQCHHQNGAIDFESHQRTKKRYQQNLKEEIENSDENDNRLEIGIRKFIEFLKTDCQNPGMDKADNGNGKKLEIRAYPSKNIHAKVYIGKFKPEDRDYGFVITGSSNFSESGLWQIVSLMLSLDKKEMLNLRNYSSNNFGKNRLTFQKTLLIRFRIRLGSTTKSRLTNSI